MKFTVAIDGPAAAGKGTISRAVAKAFGFKHMDTGLLYRAVGKKMIEQGEGTDSALGLARSLQSEDLLRDDLRTAEVAEAASVVAAISEVRAALMEFQKSFARRDGGAVLDGRDIGTVICPKAEVKIFVTASPEIRAERRYRELTEKGAKLSYAQVLSNVQERDQRDASRDAAPMRAADDALLLDTTKLSIDAAVAEALALIQKRIG